MRRGRKPEKQIREYDSGICNACGGRSYRQECYSVEALNCPYYLKLEGIIQGQLPRVRQHKIWVHASSFVRG